MPIKANIHDNTQVVKVKAGSDANNKRLESLIHQEIENRIAADDKLREENISAIKSEIDSLEASLNTQISELQSASDIISCTWAELKALRDSNQLKKNGVYRITDYVTTSAQKGTCSMGHPFDILVRALSENTLDENAGACLHENDDYFTKLWNPSLISICWSDELRISESNLSSWKLKYCLDNDTSRFAWAHDKNIEAIEVIRFSENNSTYIYKRYPEADEPGKYAWARLKTICDSDFILGISEDLWQSMSLKSPLQLIFTNRDYNLLNMRIEESGESGELKTVGAILWHICPGKGVIYEMTDEFNNCLPYDFKNIVFQRFIATGASGSGNILWPYFSSPLEQTFSTKSFWMPSFMKGNIEAQVDYGTWLFTFSSYPCRSSQCSKNRQIFDPADLSLYNIRSTKSSVTHELSVENNYVAPAFDSLKLPTTKRFLNNNLFLVILRKWNGTSAHKLKYCIHISENYYDLHCVYNTIMINLDNAAKSIYTRFTSRLQFERNRWGKDCWFNWIDLRRAYSDDTCTHILFDNTFDEEFSGNLLSAQVIRNNSFGKQYQYSRIGPIAIYDDIEVSQKWNVIDNNSFAENCQHITIDVINLSNNSFGTVQHLYIATMLTELENSSDVPTLSWSGWVDGIYGTVDYLHPTHYSIYNDVNQVIIYYPDGNSYDAFINNSTLNYSDTLALLQEED